MRRVFQSLIGAAVFLAALPAAAGTMLIFDPSGVDVRIETMETDRLGPSVEVQSGPVQTLDVFPDAQDGTRLSLLDSEPVRRSTPPQADAGGLSVDAVVPAPAAWPLFAGGLFGLLAALRNRRET